MLSCRHPRWHRNSPLSPPVPFLCLQQLNYPMRIVHPERSEGSLCQTLQSPHLDPLCFQQHPTVAVCKFFVLKSLQQWGGCMGESSHFPFSLFHFPFSSPLVYPDPVVTHHSPLSSLECAVEHPMKDASPEGVSRPKDLSANVSALECAVTSTSYLTPLECAVPKKGGGWGFSHFPFSLFHFPSRSHPISTFFVFNNIQQWQFATPLPSSRCNSGGVWVSSHFPFSLFHFPVPILRWRRGGA